MGSAGQEGGQDTWTHQELQGGVGSPMSLATKDIYCGPTRVGQGGQLVAERPLWAGGDGPHDGLGAPLTPRRCRDQGPLARIPH